MLLALAFALLIILLKPWGGAPPDSDTSSASDVATAGGTDAAAMPTGDATPIAPPTRPRDSAACYTDRAWRAVVVERSQRRESRTWFATRLAFDVADPASPSVPYRRVVSNDIVAMGFCSAEVDAGADPAADSVRPAGARIWWAHGGTVEELAGLRRVETPEPGIAELYRPPSDARDARDVWPPGDYVFQVPDPIEGRYSFGLHVVAPSRR